MKTNTIAILLALASCAALTIDAHAQTQVCGPGKDCVSRTFRTPPVPRARFSSCSSSRVGQLAFDGDAGTYRLCQFDGGWGELGGGGETLWRPVNEYTVEPSTVTGVRIDGVWATSTASPDLGNVVLSTGGPVVLQSSTGASLALEDYAQLGASDAIIMSAPNGLLFNGAASITGIPEGTFWYDGGTTLNAGATYTQLVTLSGAGQVADHDICVMEQPPGSDSQSVIATCSSADGNVLRLNWYNHSASAVDLRCSFASATCGRRVRLIQRH